ncbi:histidinol-phosphate transaminase [Prochlorococcus sp. MIT 1307]|uniref:pyridoxal phosphate-dependent aminotransferase n=1 Tax=Prochlorococcus sp. MIT 1307 TaxID=3096219 RepID=UPI002A74A3C2|nr:histidinol-phosphate transaminase [Prochlorococcus sp. MIT 1307]
MGFLERPQIFKGPSPRGEVERMCAYKAPLEGRRKLLRLDFNENTIGPSPLVVKALQNIPPHHISIYPEYDGMREALIANLNSIETSKNLEPEQVGLFNGVDAAIHATIHAYGDRGEQLITTSPTFGYYTPCAHMQGMEIVAIEYEGINFKFPTQKVTVALLKQKPKLLLICNPNNPTGTRLEAQKILNFAAIAPNTLVIVDELYEAFTGDSVLSEVDFDKTPNLLVLRSLSKTAGLAGLRIGFAIGNANVVERICRVTGPYDVNSFAITAALAALEDQAYTNDYVEEVLRAREWLKHQLITSGKRHHIDGGNYLLIWPDNESSKVTESLRKEGILVRDMDRKPLLEGALRISIGTTDQMKQFWKTFLKVDCN